MGACTHCTGRPSNEALFKDFWDGIPLRFKPAKDWAELVKTKKDKNNKITDKKWGNIIEQNLSPEGMKEVALSLWRNVYTKAEEKGELKMLFLSLIFLVQKNSFEAKTQFKYLAEVVLNMKEEFKTSEDKTVVTMKRDTMRKIVEFYVNLISLFSVKDISNISDNKLEFDNYFGKAFDEPVQKLYLDKEIFGALSDEWINYDKFFDMQYHILVDDSKIREQLIINYEKIYSKKQK